jgi:hypothetical protein
MATLSTTAWVLHDLGLAADFGGNLFGQLAMHPAIRQIESKRERARVTQTAWNRFKFVNGLGLALMAGGWLIGRTLLSLSGKEVGRRARAATIAKDALVTGAVLSGVGAIATGTLLERERDREAAKGTGPIEIELSPRIARLHRLVTAFGNAKLLFDGGVVIATTILAAKSGRSIRWSFLSRLLP